MPCLVYTPNSTLTVLHSSRTALSPGFFDDEHLDWTCNHNHLKLSDIYLPLSSCRLWLDSGFFSPLFLCSVLIFLFLFCSFDCVKQRFLYFFFYKNFDRRSSEMGFWLDADDNV